MNGDNLILRAAICQPNQALEAWLDLLGGREFHSLDGKAYRALPTVYTNLRSLDTEVPCLDQLKGTAKHAWVQNISRLRALVPLLIRLQDANIDYRLLKGAAIACLTNSWSTRIMGDVDILFRKKDTKEILEIFSQLGAKQKFNLPKDTLPTLYETWTLTAHHYSTDLDIHIAHASDKNIFGRILSCEATITQHENVFIKTPSMEWALIHSALHGKLGMARSDFLQSTLDAAKLLPLTNLGVIEKNAAVIEALDIVELTLRAIPMPSLEISHFIQKLQHLNVKNHKKRHLRKLLSRNLINLHNIRKFLGRRPTLSLLKRARTETKGRKWLYWIWLQLGQLTALEHMCIEKLGGFLDLPTTPISRGMDIAVAPPSIAHPDSHITTGSIMSHDFRVKIRLPKGVKQLTVFLEYQFLLSTFWGIYINGVPMGVLPLPGAQSGSFPVLTNNDSLEISLRSPCNRNENAMGSFRISCEWG